MHAKLLLAAFAAGLMSAALLVAFPPDADSAPQAAVNTETYEIDAAHSSLIFGINHLGVGMFYGRFNTVSGSYVLDRGNLERSSVSIEIATGSVDTASQGRDRHLKSPDFFNAKQFPKITFQSSSIRSTGNDKFEIVGDLTLIGKKARATLSVEKIGEGAGTRGEFRSGFVARTRIKRSDFNMNYMLDQKPGLGDEVDLLIAVEGIRQ